MNIVVNLPNDLVEFLGKDARTPVAGDTPSDLAMRKTVSDVDCAVTTIETLIRFYVTGKLFPFTPKNGMQYEYVPPRRQD